MAANESGTAGDDDISFHDKINRLKIGGKATSLFLVCNAQQGVILCVGENNLIQNKGQSGCVSDRLGEYLLRQL